MTTVTVHVAKTTLSKLLAQVEAGDEVVIMRGDKPVARLVPIEPMYEQRGYGSMKGQLDVPDSVFEPMSDEELDAWGL